MQILSLMRPNVLDREIEELRKQIRDLQDLNRDHKERSTAILAALSVILSENEDDTIVLSREQVQEMFDFTWSVAVNREIPVRILKRLQVRLYLTRSDRYYNIGAKLKKLAHMIR